MIISPNPMEQIYWWLSGLSLGAVPGILAPLTPKINKQRYFHELKHMADQYPDAVWCVDPDVAEDNIIASTFNGNIIMSNGVEGNTSLQMNLKEFIQNLQSTALFQQTSGTTGLRKGILLPEKCVVKQLDKYIKMIEKRTVTSVLEYNFNMLGEDRKDCFKYFGHEAKIRSPIEITHPGRIQIGNWVSLGRYGQILMQTDFSGAKKFIHQHYPEVQMDYSSIDGRIYGRRNPRLEIGDGTIIGDNFLISVANSLIIGRHVVMSARVFITDSNHRFDHPDLPIVMQSNTLGTPMTIGDHSWIGVGAVLLEGSRVGKHCVIGSNAVVNFDVPDYCVVAGNPDRIVKKIIEDRPACDTGLLPNDLEEGRLDGPLPIEDAIMQYIDELKGISVNTTDSLFSSGLIDSLGVFGLITYIESKFNLKLESDVFVKYKPDTDRDIAELIQSLGSKG